MASIGVEGGLGGVNSSAISKLYRRSPLASSASFQTQLVDAGQTETANTID
jgi:hypothetical protein